MRRSALLLGLALLTAAPALAAARTEPAVPALHGVARDALGRMVPGAEIRLAPVSRPTAAVATARTDAAGRYVVASLEPGRYALLALKRGYETFAGRVDTLTRATFDFVMIPAPETADGEPRDPAWGLRLPRRGVLREIAPGTLDEPEPAAVADLRLQVDQMFAVAAPRSESTPEASQLRATETSMDLASPLGHRTSLHVLGRRERLGADAADAASSAAGHGSSTMRVGLHHDAGGSGRVDIAAFYGEEDTHLLADTGSLSREQRRWGYDARWSKRLDENSRVALGVDFFDATMLQPGLDRGKAPALTDRTVRARGRFDHLERRRHEVEVAVLARAVHWGLSPDTDVLDAARHEGTGWRLEAEAWHVWTPASGPVDLVSGLAFREAAAADGGHVVPRMGARWASGPWTVRGVVSYHAGVQGGRGPVEGGRPTRGRVGYDAELSVPLGEGASLRAGSSFAPVKLGATAADEMGDAMRSPLYLTDGDAAVREQRLALVDDSAAMRTFLELAEGRAEGRLAALLPIATAYRVISEGAVRYRSGRFGIDLPTRGTRMRLEYQRIASEAPPDPRGRDALEEWFEFRLRQQLVAVSSLGDWHLLVAMRLGLIEGDQLEAWRARGGDAGALEALNRRVSAGVSVNF